MPALAPNPQAPRPAPGPPAPGALSEQQLAAIAGGRHAARRIRRAVAVSRASAWTTGVLGGVTLLGILFGDISSLVLGAGLVIVAVREGRLSARLARLDTRAPGALALNQLALGVLIVAYALWQARAALASTGLSSAAAPIGDAQVDAMLADIGSLARSITIAFYLCVAIVGGAGAGLMALYYRARRAPLDRFLAETPPWVVQVLRAAA